MSVYFVKAYQLAYIYDYKGSAFIAFFCGNVIPRGLIFVNEKALYLTKLFWSYTRTRLSTERIYCPQTIRILFLRKAINALLVLGYSFTQLLRFTYINQCLLPFSSIINSIYTMLACFGSTYCLFVGEWLRPFNLININSHMLGSVSRGMVYVNK